MIFTSGRPIVETPEPVILYLPHASSRYTDIKKFGRSFGRIGVCSLTGCTYTIYWDQDIWDWMKETGVVGYENTEPMPDRLFDVKFKDPSHAVLFKLRWLGSVD